MNVECNHAFSSDDLAVLWTDIITKRPVAPFNLRPVLNNSFFMVADFHLHASSKCLLRLVPGIAGCYTGLVLVVLVCIAGMASGASEAKI